MVLIYFIDSHKPFSFPHFSMNACYWDQKKVCLLNIWIEIINFENLFIYLRYLFLLCNEKHKSEWHLYFTLESFVTLYNKDAAISSVWIRRILNKDRIRVIVLLLLNWSLYPCCQEDSRILFDMENISNNSGEWFLICVLVFFAKIGFLWFYLRFLCLLLVYFLLILLVFSGEWSGMLLFVCF